MMDPMSIFIVLLYIVTLPLMFHLLRYIRLEELFKRRTPPEIIAMLYIVISIAMTQLVLGYFISLFTTIGEIM